MTPPPTLGGMPADPNAAKRAQAAERRTQVFELRKAGATLRQIAEQLGVSHVQVLRDLRASFARLATLEVHRAEEARLLDLERLDALQVAHWPAALRADPESSKIVLTIMRRRAELHGYVRVAVPSGPPAGGERVRIVIEFGPAVPALPEAPAVPPSVACASP